MGKIDISSLVIIIRLLGSDECARLRALTHRETYEADRDTGADRPVTMQETGARIEYRVPEERE